jgi:hypothetical protein
MICSRQRQQLSCFRKGQRDISQIIKPKTIQEQWEHMMLQTKGWKRHQIYMWNGGKTSPMGSLQESDLTKGLNCINFTPVFCMLVVSMKHTSKHRTRNIHSTEVKLSKEKNIAISFPTCIVCVFPLLAC